MRLFLPLALCSTSCLLGGSRVLAFSGGAGGCAGNGPAVGGGHVRDGAISGSLASFGVEVQFNNEAFDPDLLWEILTDTVYNVNVIASENDQIKGCLIRMEATSGTLTPEGDNVEEASACADIDNVQGVTHTNSEFKTGCAAVLLFEGDGSDIDVRVDVTVVFENGEASRWAHSGYDIVAKAEFVSPMPSEMPSVPPVVGEDSDEPTSSPGGGDEPTAAPVGGMPTDMPDVDMPTPSPNGDMPSAGPKSDIPSMIPDPSEPTATPIAGTPTAAPDTDATPTAAPDSDATEEPTTSETSAAVSVESALSMMASLVLGIAAIMV